MTTSESPNSRQTCQDPIILTLHTEEAHPFISPVDIIRGGLEAMNLDFVEMLLLAVSVLFAVIAVEQSRLVRSVMSLLGYTATLGVIFFILGAYPVAIFQLLIYAGGIIALFIFVIILTKGYEE
ncbi:MAG: NADH-quinone oxidoreductase subunit J [Candidatus Caldarchaeum sp.]